MERPAKRQKLSSIETISYQRYPSATISSSNDLIASSIPTRTLNLADFQRPSLIFESQNYPKSPQRRRNPGRVILPRAPDVTVTTGVLEVAVNDGSISTQIAVPTTDIALSLNSLGTLTVPAQTTANAAASSSSTGSSNVSNSVSISSSGSISSSNVSSGSTDLTATARNATALLSSVTERTATVTSTSTFHVSYVNGTFIAATSTQQYGTSVTNSNGLSHITGNVYSSTQGSLSFDPDQTGVSDTTGIQTGGGNTAGISATATGSNPHSSGSAAAGGGDNGGGGGGDNGGSGGTTLTPQQTQMVGGIVGGLAGIALIAFALLYVLRWYRQRLTSRSGLKRLVDFDVAHNHHDAAGLVNKTGTMSSTSHSSFFPSASALITSPKHWRTGLETVNRSGTISPESEKGFQRIAGRKIPPVLSTGGDQYGDSHSSFHNSNSNVFDEKVGVAISTPTRQETFHHHQIRPTQRVLSDASVYSDYEGMYAHNTSNPQHESSYSEPTTPIHGSSSAAMLHHNHYSSNDRLRRPPLSHVRSYQDIALEDLSRALTSEIGRPDGFAVIRNSPARTPVTQSPIASSIVLPVQAPVSMDEDIPEMPLSSGNYPVGAAYGLGLGHDLLARRIPSRVSARSNSGSGRFREELA